MPYSLDLRTRVITFVENGGGITKASQLFQISRTSIYRWFNRTHLQPTKVLRRKRKIDLCALEKDVAQNPDLRLIDRAQKFNVTPSAISYALKKLKIIRKKAVRTRDDESRKGTLTKTNNFAIENEIATKELNTSKF